MDDVDPARSLEMMRMTRRALANRARWSLARHASVGLLLGALIAGYSLPGQWPVLIAAVTVAATAMVVSRDRRRDGFFVNGYRAGRTRWITFLMLFVAIAALIGAILLKTRYGLIWAPIALGGTTAVFATIMSVIWERVYRRELHGALKDG